MITSGSGAPCLRTTPISSAPARDQTRISACSKTESGSTVCRSTVDAIRRSRPVAAKPTVVVVGGSSRGKADRPEGIARLDMSSSTSRTVDSGRDHRAAGVRERTRRTGVHRRWCARTLAAPEGISHHHSGRNPSRLRGAGPAGTARSLKRGLMAGCRRAVRERGLGLNPNERSRIRVITRRSRFDPKRPAQHGEVPREPVRRWVRPGIERELGFAGCQASPAGLGKA